MAALVKGADCAVEVPGVPALAELALAFNAIELNLDADDLAELAGPVILRGVTHLPRFWFPSLALSGQLRDHAPDELLVVEDVYASVGMDDLVIPRGHVPMRLMLAGIPVRRDIALNP